MTRREEIELAWLSKAVQSNHRYDEKSFKEAVEWADKTMIDKACEWLMKYFVLDHKGMSPYGYGVFEYMFRKAMETDYEDVDL